MRDDGYTCYCAVRVARCNVSIHLGMKILNPLSFPKGGVQPRRREKRPSSITRKFDTWGKGAKRERERHAAQEKKVHFENKPSISQQVHTDTCLIPTCLGGDCHIVSYEAGVDGIDSEGISGFRTQLCHQCCAHVCLQIDLLHTQKRKKKGKLSAHTRVCGVCAYICMRWKERKKWSVKMTDERKDGNSQRQCSDTHFHSNKHLVLCKYSFISSLPI